VTIASVRRPPRLRFGRGGDYAAEWDSQTVLSIGKRCAAQGIGGEGPRTLGSRPPRSKDSCMFGTVLHDVFRDDERGELAAALEDLCSPLDSYGWASVGIYAFFDPAGGQPTIPDADDFQAQLQRAGSRTQYLGLARDLPERFRQHAGLRACPPWSCKRVQIHEWFAQRPSLGFSCFVQSPLAQVNTHRERGRSGGLSHKPDLSSSSSTCLKKDANQRRCLRAR